LFSTPTLGTGTGPDGVDVILDYLYGQWAESLLAAIGRTHGITRPIRYVSIGGVSAQQITLPSVVMRGTPLVLMGSGIGSAHGKTSSAPPARRCTLHSPPAYVSTQLPYPSLTSTRHGTPTPGNPELSS
jgi:NADPH:quinone reductase-like Zn-dependent oxidoreductase